MKDVRAFARAPLGANSERLDPLLARVVSGSFRSAANNGVFNVLRHSVLQHGKHRQARKVQRPKSEYDDLACLPCT